MSKRTEPSLKKWGRRSVGVNFRWNAAGWLVYAACQGGMLASLARIGNATLVGKYALALALTAPISMFFNLQLRELLATDARSDFAVADYVRLRVITTVMSFVVAIAVGFIAGLDSTAMLVVAMVGLGRAFESGSDILYGLFQRRQALEYVAKSRVQRGVGGLACMIVGLALSGSVVVATASIAVAWLLVLLFYDLSVAKKMPASTARRGFTADTSLSSAGLLVTAGKDLRSVGRLARLAMPLGLVMMTWSLIPNIPRYFIEGQFGSAELGIFAAVAYLLIPGVYVVNALGQASAPRLSAYLAQSDHAGFGRLLTTSLISSLLLGIAGLAFVWAAGSQVLHLVYGPPYAHYRLLLFWLMAAAAAEFVATYLHYVMNVLRELGTQAIILAFSCSVCAAASLILIPQQGLVGAAVALTVANACRALLSLFVVGKSLLEVRGGRIAWSSPKPGLGEASLR